MAQPAKARSADGDAAPEHGQLVRVRHRLFVVEGIVTYENGSSEVVTRVDLECLDDDRLGERHGVLWERKVHTQIIGEETFPRPSGRWDHPSFFDAFLKAIRWSAASKPRGSVLQAPVVS